MCISKESIKKIYESMSEEKIKALNASSIQKAEDDYREFKKAFDIGTCSLCGKPLKTFSKENPCLHWMLRPKNVKKKDIHELLQKKKFFQLMAYLRWVANQENFFKNINDLKDEKDPSKIVETTIQYKHIKWSISSSINDYNGHIGKSADFPHYHLEMKLNGQVFIKFNDFHLKFQEEDLFKLISIIDLGAVERYSSGGDGMQFLMDQDSEILIEHLITTEDERRANVEISSLAYFEDGIDISEIEKLINTAKESGTTVAKLLKAKADSCQSIITPHETVPEMQKRSGRKKGT